jgi:hypothetical protein
MAKKKKTAVESWVESAARQGWEEVQEWKEHFPAGTIEGAKDVLSAVMARAFVNEKDRNVVSAGRVLAAIIQAEAAKLTAEKPITVVFGADKDDLGL